MSRFMASHTLPPGGVTREQLTQLSQASQQDAVVRGYRSFSNLTEGKIVCVFDAPNKEALAAWFQKMNIPYDSITQLELEGESGVIEEV